MARYVTILDIAKELGISKSTVSRALSGDTGNVKAETLQKILSTAERMGYHRNEQAVNLRKQSTHNIGIIISACPRMWLFEVKPSTESLSCNNNKVYFKNFN